MPAVRRLVLLAVWVGLLPGLAAAQSRGSSGIPTEQSLNRLGLTRAWWGQAVVDPQRNELIFITTDEQNLYVQASSGIVTAFNADTGRRLWSTLLGMPDQQSYPVATNETTLLLAIGMRLFACNKFTGEVIWQLDLPHHPSTSPEIDSKYVYIGMVDGSVYAYDLMKIRQLYEENRLPQWTNIARFWRYQTPAEVTSPPISTGRIVAFSSLNGMVYAVNSDQNRLAFQFETDGAIRIPVAHNRESLFVASDDARLFCLNEINGRTRWAFTSGQPIRKPASVIGPQVFVTPEHGGMYCLSTVSGLRRWHQPRATEFLAASADTVFASDLVGNVLLLSRGDGQIVGALPYRNLTLRCHNERTDRLFLASGDGLVVCIHQRNQAFPLYHMYPERRPIQPEFAPEEGAETPAEADAPAEGEMPAPESN